MSLPADLALSSKLLAPVLFLLFFVLSGCGVKSDPVPPPGTQLPSYVDRFLETDQEKESEDGQEKEQ